MDLNILYEDNHLIVVNKAQTQLVQGDQTGDIAMDQLLRTFLKEKYNKPGNVFIGVVHRLDRPVSGVVVFARTSKALTRMNQAFRNQEVRKKYWAIVEDAPPDNTGTLVHYLKRNREKNKSTAFSTFQPGSKKASLTYHLCGEADHYFFLEIELHTGRHHQIRSQLAAMGCRIKGDLKYGARRSNPGGGISLHARELQFRHPVRKEMMTITARPPDEPLWRMFEQLEQ